MLNDNKQSTKVTSAAVSRKSLDKDITRNSKGIVELHLNNPSKTKLGVPLLTTDISLSSFKDVIDNVFTHFIPPPSADPTVLADDPVLEVPILPPDGTFIRRPSGRSDMKNWDIWWIVNGKKQRVVSGNPSNVPEPWWKNVQVMLRERELTYSSIQLINSLKDWQDIPVDSSRPMNWPRTSEWSDYHPSETGYEALPPNDPGESTYWDDMRVKYEGKMVFVPGDMTGPDMGLIRPSLMPPNSLFVLINGKWRPIIDFNVTRALPRSSGPSLEHHPENNPDYAVINGQQIPSWFRQRKDAIILFDAIARTNGVPTFSENSKPYVNTEYGSPINGSLWWSANSFSVPGKAWVYGAVSSNGDAYTGTDANTFSIDDWDWRGNRGIGSWFPDPETAERLEPYVISGTKYKLRGADAVFKTIHGTSYEILNPSDPVVERNSPFWEAKLPQYLHVGMHVTPLTLDEYLAYLDAGPDKWDKQWLEDYYPKGDEKYYESPIVGGGGGGGSAPQG